MHRRPLTSLPDLYGLKEQPDSLSMHGSAMLAADTSLKPVHAEQTPFEAWRKGLHNGTLLLK